ncbi:MAG: HlyD family efflux transporter periplasmic adaptor subunit [Pseudomonadota bacterium]
MKTKTLLMTTLLATLLMLTACQEETTGWYGTVERERHTLTAPASELITSVLVREGDLVKAGQLLLTLDTTSVDARIAQRRAELAEVQALQQELIQGPRSESLALAEAAIRGADAALLEAQQRLDRVAPLLQAGAATQSDQDQARAARDLAQSALEQATQTLTELRNGTRSEQLLQVEARVAAAQARLTVDAKALADLSLLSAHDAVVDSLPWQQGDRVAQGTQLISLLIETDAFVRVYVPAEVRDQLAPGQPLSIQPDGDIPAFTGTIRHIRPQPAFTPYYALNERDRARLMYLTEITLPASHADLPSGMTVEVLMP